mmetsp:Transcript_52024/g.113192  ORF Transcript_52024/g.113192 Transcript_52024/m.113192 type:complete len:208 (-) Transcript_52024:639-1262(-)
MPSSGLPKKPQASTPHIPQTPWTGKASTTSSTLSLVSNKEAPTYSKPPMQPMMQASHGFMTAHPAVMETRPAKMPLQKAPTSRHFGSTTLARRKNTSKPATQGESVVLTATMPARLAVSASCMDPVLPGLKPYHPNQRQNVPKTQKGTLCPSNSVERSGSHRPFRDPTMMAPRIAPMPPTKCTTPLPAKSITGGVLAKVTDLPSSLV